MEMDVHLHEAEIACIERLAELYEAGKIKNGRFQQADPQYNLGVPDEKWEVILGMMETYRAIEDVSHSDGIRDGIPFFAFRISAIAVQIARRIREKEQEKKTPRNIVEEIKETAKGNRILASIIVGFIVLAAIVAFANQLLELLKKFGVSFP